MVSEEAHLAALGRLEGRGRVAKGSDGALAARVRAVREHERAAIRHGIGVRRAGSPTQRDDPPHGCGQTAQHPALGAVALGATR